MRYFILAMGFVASFFCMLATHAAIVMGNATGPVTLVEIYDYQCPACKAMVPVVNMLTKDDPYLRVVYTNFPFLGENSVYAAKAAIASVEQNKFPAFHEALMVFQGTLTPQNVLAVAKQVGLNVQQLTQTMNSPEVTDELAKQIQVGSELGVRVTPTFIIGATRADVNPRQFQGVVDYITLQNAIVLVYSQSSTPHPDVKPKS